MTYDVYRSQYVSKSVTGGGRQCLICGKILLTQLKRHFLEQHTPPLFVFRCPLGCPNNFQMKRTLAVHIAKKHPQLSSVDLSKCTVPVEQEEDCFG